MTTSLISYQGSDKVQSLYYDVEFLDARIITLLCLGCLMLASLAF